MKLIKFNYSPFNISLANFFYKKFKKNLYHLAKVDPETQCSFCKSSGKSFYLSKTFPDFDARVLPENIFNKFYYKSIGKCSSCGLTQDYNRLTLDEIYEYENYLDSKDMSHSEEVWESYPVPEHVKDEYKKRNLDKRFLRWNEELKIERDNIKNVLFLRPSMGLICEYFTKNFSANFYYLDISNISIKTIQYKYPSFTKLNGDIHAYYRGDFLKKENFFDLIVSHHNLIHCFNIDHSMKHLNKMITENGKIIFTDEIVVKPWNPFHVNFWDEKIFIKILKKYFSNIELIRDCGAKYEYITDYTLENDNPDFIASKKL